MSEESRHIIESGELELYLLGALDAARATAIENMIASDSSIAREVEEIRTALNSLSEGYSINPPPQLREDILGAAFRADSGIDSRASSAQPEQSPTVLPLSTTASPHRYTYALRYAVAASLLFVVSTSSALYFWNKNRTLSGELAEAQGKIAEMENSRSVLTSKVTMYGRYMSMVGDEHVMKVRMSADAAFALIKASPAVPMATHSMVLWDTHSNKVYLDPHSLPPNQPDTDYQLWALVKGEPVDLGTFNTAEPMPMLSMKDISQADAFAVTVEPKGGSKSPTLSKMCVLGKATS